MDLKEYFNIAPKELEIDGCEKDYQLLKVYAFNAYYSADEVRIEDINSGCTYRRDNKEGIDGVYINETLEDNTIECVYSYYVGDTIFSINNVLNKINVIKNEIKDVNDKHFFGNQAADNLLSSYLNDSEDKKVIIRIITDYIPEEDEKFYLLKQINDYDVSVKGLKVTAEITFGDDVISEIEANKAPFDFVSEGKLNIDKPDNFLKYEDHSIICNISAKSLKDLWRQEGKRGLLAMNLRYYIKSGAIDTKIEDSIQLYGNEFWYLNNGIIIVCNDYNIVGNEIRLKQFSIVNGGQTTRMIGETPFRDDFYVSCKIIKNVFTTMQEKNEFISKVAEASNTQKPIKAKDIIANRVEQRNLKSLLNENGIFIEIKRGEKCFKENYPEAWQKTKNNELAQDLYSFVYMQPGPARNSLTNILSSDEKYNIIFKNHTYPAGFLKSLIMLEKAYREYVKKIGKLDETDNDIVIKKGLVKNGLTYTLATIGYLLKLYYNTEYKRNIQKYRNFEGQFSLIAPELAFINTFVDPKLNYEQFKSQVYELFDAVFTNILIPRFKVAKEGSPSIVYSNWTKTNTGFNEIVKYINCNVFDNKDEYLIKLVSRYFKTISQDESNNNIDTYADYLKANKKLKEDIGSDSRGNELKANDKKLRDELMLYRYNKSQTKHIKESVIFTDKMLDALVTNKPTTNIELKKIVNASTLYYSGDDILNIINKYI